MTLRALGGICAIAASVGAEYAAKHAIRERIRDTQESHWLTQNLRGKAIDRFIDRVYGIHARHADLAKKRGLW